MIEVGDMIQYKDWNRIRCDDDIGWVVHVERRERSSGSELLIYIKWLKENDTDTMWEHSLVDQDEAFTLIKGGQHAK